MILALIRPRLLALPALAGLLASPLAQAHDYVRGVGSFYAGMLHPVLAPAHLLALLALGLLFGQRGMTTSRDAMLALVLALCAGLFAAAPLHYPDTDTALFVLAIMTAACVALAYPKWPGRVSLAGLAAVAGLAIGLGSAPEELPGSAWYVASGGTLLTAFLCVSLLTAAVEPLRAAWMKIGVRVAASWIAACALLVLTLSLAPRPGKAVARETPRGENSQPESGL